MNFLAKSLIEETDEVIAFWTFIFILDEREMNAIVGKFSDYYIRNYQIDYFLKKKMKKLHNHFTKLGVDFSIVTSTMIIVLFYPYMY